MGKQFFIVFFKGYQTPVTSGADNDGTSFLDENHHKTSLEATWSNILDLIRDHSPICGAKFASVFDQVCTMAYDDYDFDVENCPNEIYQAVRSFESFAKTKLPTTPTLVRAFLRHTLKCTRLFTGDGYCCDEQGRRGAKEYLIPRVRLDQLTGATPPFLLRL